MAKDPAFLFYPGDWLGGTMLLTRHQKGCYIDLLMAQFNSGPLSLDHIKTVLGQDQATWTVLRGKFKADNNGMFFNEKLATEIEKRKAYTASLSQRGQGRKKSIDKSSDFHKNKHMEDVNENEDLNGSKGVQGENWKCVFPFDSENFKLLWSEWKTYLKTHRKQYQTFSSEQAGLEFVSKMSEAEATETIKTCMRNNWKNLRKVEFTEKTGKLETALSINEKLTQQIKQQYESTNGNRQ